MKVAHFAQFGPHRAGQYATVKDLILAERALGVDAQLIDSALPCKQCGFYEVKVGCRDGEIITQSPEWAYGADLLVRHTAIPTSIENLGIPMILCLHGRPENTFALERLGQMPIYSFLEQIQFDLRYKAYITFWEEFLPLWSLLMPSDKLNYVPAPVNLQEFKPEGPQFDFGSRCGSPNLVIADMWREDDTPFNLTMAASIFHQKYCPTAKLHIFGLPQATEGPIAVLARALNKEGVWGNCFTLHNEMPAIYRAADILLTPHVIATRIIREACASGTPFIAGTGCPYTPFTANPKDIEGYAKQIQNVWAAIQSGSIHNLNSSRQIAKEEFDMEKAGKAMVEVFDKVLAKSLTRKAKRKVFIDIGGHTGESILNFYRQVNDAEAYRIYSFEPGPEAFAQLTKNVGRIKNVQLENKAVGECVSVIPFYLGYMHTGEGSTTLQGKRTGSIDYARPINVEQIDFVQWFNENISDSDIVVVKMNIEGGEYSLIPEIIEANLMSKISVLYVQFHSDKFEDPKPLREIEARFELEHLKHPTCQVIANRMGQFSFANLNKEQ